MVALDDAGTIKQGRRNSWLLRTPGMLEQRIEDETNVIQQMETIWKGCDPTFCKIKFLYSVCVFIGQTICKLCIMLLHVRNVIKHSSYTKTWWNFQAEVWELHVGQGLPLMLWNMYYKFKHICDFGYKLLN